MIGRLFGRKPNDDAAARSAGRLITSREPTPATPSDARANDARIDAAVEAAHDTVSLSPLAQALPAAPAISAPPVAPVAPVEPAASVVADAAASARSESGEVRRAEAAFGREGGSDPWLADAFDRLFAEEQGEAPADSYGGAYSLSEADLDRIATRVADRLTRGALGDTVTRIVTDVSERLVREEIQRIRQSASPSSDQQS